MFTDKTKTSTLLQFAVNKIILIHVGNFYYCYGRDTYIMSYLFQYKVNILKDNIYSCSFPSTVYNKIINILQLKKINYIVLDKRCNYEVDEKQNFKNINAYQKYYEISQKPIKF